MSRSFSASQYDKSYNPRSLGNWEVPDGAKVVKSPSGGCPAHKTADGRTVPIVNAQGHIVKGIKKAAAFVLQPSQRSSAQWPQQTVDAKCASAATMGYKSDHTWLPLANRTRCSSGVRVGIPTSYLPTSTVPLRAVEVEGCKEANFNPTPH